MSQGREKERGAVIRAVTASPWHCGGKPRRAHTGTATRGEAERSGAGLGDPGGGEAVWLGGRRAAGDPGRPAEQGRRGRAERE